MQPLTAIRHIAAPELNFLLTEPPFEVGGQFDFGWFCREHAFCTVVIAELYGLKCRVVLGDFLVNIPGRDRLTSLTTGVDHAWCSTVSADVLDLSLHFRKIWQKPQLAEPIWRFGRNGVFEICRLAEDSTIENDYGTKPIVGYIPRRTLDVSAIDLVNDPRQLLTSESGEISCSIVLHVFHLLSNNTRGLARRMSQPDALHYLCKEYSNAQMQLSRLLRSGQ